MNKEDSSSTNKISLSNPIILALLLGGGGLAGGTGLGSLLHNENKNLVDNIESIKEDIEDLKNENTELQEELSYIKSKIYTVELDTCKEKLSICLKWKEEYFGSPKINYDNER